VETSGGQEREQFEITQPNSSTVDNIICASDVGIENESQIHQAVDIKSSNDHQSAALESNELYFCSC
jgi:hypothetical protein